MSQHQSILPRDLSRTAVIFIEFQREWLGPESKLQMFVQDRQQFSQAIEGGKRLLEIARRHGMPVIHSGLRYAEGHPELGTDGLGLRAAIKQFKTFPVDGTGSKFADGFEPLPGEFVPAGRTGASAFAGSNLDTYLRANRINDILICGFALHVCVESTLRAAHDLGYNCWLVEDATTAFTAQQRDHVLNHVAPHFGVSLTTSQLEHALASRKAA